MKGTLTLLLLVLWPALGRAQVWQQQGQPPQLIALYTSEGCSSCPPADARLAGLLDHPQLWQRVVPLAFHVDYWDYLGWRDPFASAAFSQRQRDHYRAGHLRSVYTPAWLVDGAEWRGYFQRQAWPQPTARDGGRLRAELDGTRLHIRYSNAPGALDNRALSAHVAVLGFDLSSRVTAGENRGRRLAHQFVVTQQQTVAGRGEWWFDLHRTAGERQALVVWIAAAQQAAPLQVVAGWLE